MKRGLTCRQAIIPISQLRIDGQTGNIDVGGHGKDVNTGILIKRDRGNFSEEQKVCVAGSLSPSQTFCFKIFSFTK